MGEWKRTTIGQILKEREGRYSPDDKKLAGLERLNKIDFTGEIHLSSKGSKTDMIIVKPGDLVISGINVAKGAIAVHQGEKPITATIHYSSYVFDKNQIDIEYFKRFVKSQTFVKTLEVRGGIKTEIKPKHFLPIEIDLPNIDEQREIAFFFRRIEDNIGDLGSEILTQSNYLAKLRQAVLQEAIEGKLTAEWRKQNPRLISGENHASKLLEKIKSNKERLIKEGKIKKDKPLLPIPNEKKPFALPEGWAWCRLGEICSVVRGGSPRPAGSKQFYDGEIPFLKVADLTADSGIYLRNHSYTIKEAGLHKTRYVEADILMLTNSGATLGVPKICTFPTTFNDGIAAFLGLHQEINKIFLYYFLKAKSLWFLAEAARGQGQPNLNTDIIGFTILALPPHAEQQAIAKRVEKLMAMIDELEKQGTERKAQSERLMQSVLRETVAK